MNRKAVLILALLLFLYCLQCPIFQQNEAKATDNYPVHNLNTGLNYTTIQDAINANETLDGHTILVDPGTYHELITVNKSISLIGENRTTTIIDGGAALTSILNIVADGVNVSGFTVQNPYTVPEGAGINVEGVRGSVIVNNTVWRCGYGIYLANSSDCTIIDNTLMQNVYSGILLYLTNNTIVSNNTGTTSEFDGIQILQSNNNTINGNSILQNGVYPGEGIGIHIIDSFNNTLRCNNMSDNTYNIEVEGQSLQEFINDIDDSNIVDGKPVCYWVSQHDRQVPYDAGYVVLVNSSNINVQDLNLTGNGQGILCAYTTNSAITNVSSTGNIINIELFYSDNNTLLGNNIMGSRQYGVWFDSSSSNTMVGNNVTGDFQAGITLEGDNNSITGNRIIANGYGIAIGFSAWYNLIYHNTFINNTLGQALSGSGGNINYWDNGFEGNYWSDYNGTDANHDGIGDTPYVIDANNIDDYPLMGPFSDFSVTGGVDVQVVSNSTVSDFQYNGTAILFNVSGTNGTTGFCNVCVPTSLLNGTISVFVNGTQVQYSLLPSSNSSVSYLYFTYGQSTEQVTVLPEFPDSLILAMFMLAAALSAIVIYKKKHSLS
jgi:parallel beta-helix repeat protein